jgi:adenylate cyclase
MSAPVDRPLLPSWAVVTEDSDRQAGRILREYAEDLVRQGVPLWRCSTFLLNRHPDVMVRQLIWRLGERFSSDMHRYQSINDDEYLKSPAKVVQDTRSPVRRHLHGPQALLDYHGLSGLAKDGGTDYFALPLIFSDGRCSFLSFATDLPSGFSQAHIERLEKSVAEIGPRLELASANFALESLLSVYLGPSAANRIFQNDARRGAGNVIHGALWRCDLGGSRSLADHRPAKEVLQLLDRYVEAATQAVVDSEGEVLELGEGSVLGVFPVRNSGPVDACRRALKAAERAIEELGSFAREAGIGDDRPVRIALHVGEVTYGNVGSYDRLHFAAIGAPVNELARLSRLCSTLKVPLVASRQFADHVPGELVSLGEHSLKDSAPREVLTLGDYGPAESREGKRAR